MHGSLRRIRRNGTGTAATRVRDVGALCCDRHGLTGCADVRWGLLAGAISVEIASTMLLRASHGFTRLVPTVVVLSGYAVSFALLSRVLRAGIPVGVAYAIWSATGTAAVAVLGHFVFSDPLPLGAVAGFALIIGGVVLVVGRGVA